MDEPLPTEFCCANLFWIRNPGQLDRNPEDKQHTYTTIQLYRIVSTKDIIDILHLWVVRKCAIKLPKVVSHSVLGFLDSRLESIDLIKKLPMFAQFHSTERAILTITLHYRSPFNSSWILFRKSSFDISFNIKAILDAVAKC